MRHLQELVVALRAIDVNAPSYPAEFEATLADVIALSDPVCIGPLIDLFEDRSRHEMTMWSIIHTIEKFDVPTYVQQMIISSVAFCNKSPRWASIVFMRMLNDPEALVELVRQLRSADQESKNSIRSLMEKINQVSYEFMPKTIPVIFAASQPPP